MSKLYTEEQVKIAIKKSCLMWQNIARSLSIRDVYDEVLNQVTPIELPSDEEIEKEFTMGNQIFIDRINGAKWMLEQIKGGKDA